MIQLLKSWAKAGIRPFARPVLNRLRLIIREELAAARNQDAEAHDRLRLIISEELAAARSRDAQPGALLRLIIGEEAPYCMTLALQIPIFTLLTTFSRISETSRMTKCCIITFNSNTPCHSL